MLPIWQRKVGDEVTAMEVGQSLIVRHLPMHLDVPRRKALGTPLSNKAYT